VSHIRIKRNNNKGNDVLYKQEGGNTRACELELKWLPGDLRFHMKNEAQRSWSRSPPSLAAQEEYDDAESSSDFLLAVTSSAAAANTDALTNNGAIETLHNKLRSRLTATLTPAEESILDMNDTMLRVIIMLKVLLVFRNDHTTVTAPLPVCSAKLSTVGPG
jgi:hypothetical protein